VEKDDADAADCVAVVPGGNGGVSGDGGDACSLLVFSPCGCCSDSDMANILYSFCSGCVMCGLINANANVCL
jgi:hypothetical protein